MEKYTAHGDVAGGSSSNALASASAVGRRRSVLQQLPASGQGERGRQHLKRKAVGDTLSRYELPSWAQALERVPPPDLSAAEGVQVTVPLPGYSPDSGQGATTVSHDIVDEDLYLRSLAYRLASDVVDESLDRAWASAFNGRKNHETDLSASSSWERGPLISSLAHFFDQYTPCRHSPTSDIGLSNQVRERSFNASARACSSNEQVWKDKKGSVADAGDSPAKGESGIREQHLFADTIAKEATAVLRPRSKDPSILPVALLATGPSIVDRGELAKLIHCALSNRGCRMRTESSATKRAKVVRKNHDPMQSARPAICVIRGAPYRSASKKKSFHGDLMREILSQCIAQESHRSQYLNLLGRSKRSRFKHVNYTERLTEWASLTEEFHSVVVILEDPENVSHRTFDAFVTALTHLRAIQGVPIGLVMTDVGHLRSNTSLSRSAVEGLAGLDIKSFEAPPSEAVFDKMMSYFFGEAGEKTSLPPVLEGGVLYEIKKCFLDNNKSVVEASLQIKLALAHHFSHPGSFLSMVQSSTFIASEWQRVAWFFVDSEARKLTTGDSALYGEASSDFVRRIRDLVWRRRIFVLLNASMKLAREVFQSFDLAKADLLSNTTLLEGRLLQSDALVDYFKVLRQLIEKIPPLELRKLLILLRKEIFRHESSFEDADRAFSMMYEYIIKDPFNSDGMGWRLLREDINSFIVLVDSHESELASSLSNAAKNHEMLQELRFSIINFLEVRCKLLPGDSSSPNANSGKAKLMRDFTTQKSLQPHVRRSIAVGLASPPPNLPRKNESITHDPIVAFQSMKCRVVSIDEWYGFFLEVLDKDCSADHDILWQRFTFSVLQLEQCGLVSRSRRRENSFEKTAMVWSSGV